MLSETTKIYNDEIKHEAARRFGADPDSLSELEGFENFVYACQVDGAPRILRVTHSLHRSQSHIRGELTWINDMAQRGVPVAAAQPSLAGNFTEAIPHPPSGTYFTATLFESAPGVILDDDPEAKARYWNTDLFEQWGEVLGQIHDHAQYQAPALKIQRPQWHEYDVLELDRFIPADQQRVLEVARAHLEKLHQLPKSPDCYGLTHADLTQWNFNVQDGKLMVYDFDSCEYGWFVKDLAVSLYYAGASYEGPDKDPFNQKFWQHLVKGYRRVRHISDDWLARLPDFLFLQRIILYAFSHQIMDPQNPAEDEVAYLKKARKIIEAGKEPIQIDFKGL
jgi:Ser/Thr protein kinase RdoA (MazF antagonist)